MMNIEEIDIPQEGNKYMRRLLKMMLVIDPKERASIIQVAAKATKYLKRQKSSRKDKKNSRELSKIEELSEEDNESTKETLREISELDDVIINTEDSKIGTNSTQSSKFNTNPKPAINQP
jgi:hypothetical protein